MPKPRTKHKRIIFIGDTHCGSLTGLTLPHWRYGGNDHHLLQVEMAEWLGRKLKGEKYDHCVLMGDLVDGSGVKNGAESITTDMGIQLEMAAAVVGLIDAREFHLIAGTPIHTITRDGVDIEAILARKIGATFQDHLFLDINGIVFDCKHHIGQSNVPKRSTNAMRNEILWNMIHTDSGGQPRSSVFIRSHVHHYKFYGDSDHLAITMPCLQGGGSRYGRRFPTRLDIGFVEFEIDDKGGYSWRPKITRLESAKSRLVRG